MGVRKVLFGAARTGAGEGAKGVEIKCGQSVQGALEPVARPRDIVHAILESNAR
jgi:hypothetical protein